MSRQAMAQIATGVLKVGETPKVKSSPGQTTWQGVSNVSNVADVISVVMSRSYVDELSSGRNGGYWRFVSSERIQELLDLGEPDEYNRLYFKIVREGKEKGLYLIDRGQWERTAPKNSLTLYVTSIKDAIKEGRPLALYVNYGGIYRDGLVLDGYGGGGVARAAQNEDAREASAPKSNVHAALLRRAQAQLEDLSERMRPEKIDAISEVLERLKRAA